MTQEEKAKAYDEALEKAKSMINDLRKGEDILAVSDLESMFPELKESEDERIKKVVKDFVENYLFWEKNNLTKEDALDWLEKQGEQSSEEVEPKFHKGDWITNKEDVLWQIDEVRTENYLLIDSDGILFAEEIAKIDSEFHLWSIEDTKDGDVLACENGWTCIFNCLHNNLFNSYCFMDAEGWFCEDGGQAHTLDNRICGEIHPATKEQRDLLFQKMKEAGYEWNKQEKRLIKVPKTKKETGVLKQLIDEGNPAWSEEDEAKLKSILFHIEDVENKNVIDWLKSLKDRVQPKQEWSEEGIRNIENIDSVLFYDKDLPEDTCVRLRNWLKSLKPQNTWKPSDEQLDALHDAAVYVDKSMFPHPKGILMKLYKQLKKLREK